MSVYLLGATKIIDPRRYAEYSKGAMEALAPYQAEGVEFLSADDHPLVLDGKVPNEHLFILKFVSMDQVKAFYHSEAYQAVLHKRHQSAETSYIMAMRGTDEHR